MNECVQTFRLNKTIKKHERVKLRNRAKFSNLYYKRIHIAITWLKNIRFLDFKAAVQLIFNDKYLGNKTEITSFNIDNKVEQLDSRHHNRISILLSSSIKYHFGQLIKTILHEKRTFKLISTNIPLFRKIRLFSGGEKIVPN